MKKFILIIISIFCLAFTFGDMSKLKIVILNKLNNYSTNLYPEKIYLHTDKPYYTAGEDIWFSAYLLNGITHQKTSKSNVVYVQLVNEKDSIISEYKLFTEKTNTNGDFKLPSDLAEGNYKIQAYTNYMRNQPQDYFFTKNVRIFSLNSSNNLAEKSDDIQNKEILNIGFYPESGYLVNGLNNKVAVKIKDADLNANPVSGIIEDSEGIKVSNFTTAEYGMASFILKPEIGKKYVAKVENGNETIVYDLPNPLEKGYILNTLQNEEEVIINISTNNPQGLENTLIIGQQRGQAAFDYINENDKKSILIKIPKKDLIEGILDIVLFDETEKPVAERLVFIIKEDNISVSVKKTNTKTTNTRDRVNLKIDIKDNEENLVPSILSLSVTDASIIQRDSNSENIKTYLLLNSDLRGAIKSPNYFFEGENTIKKSYLLDLIMLTHGWRRFSWQEFVKENTVQKFNAENGIYISGYTKDAKSPYRTKSTETKLTFRKEGFFQELQQTKKNGYFSYGPFYFKNSMDALLQASDEIYKDKPDFTSTFITLNEQNKTISITSEEQNTPFEQTILNLATYKEKSRNNVVRNFSFENERELLDQVILKQKLDTQEEIKNRERDRRTVHFTPSHRIVVDEMGDTGAGDFTNLILQVPGIRIGPSSNGTSDIVITLRGLVPTYFLNGIRIDLQTALTLYQADIDFVDVLNTGPASAVYGLQAQGVIAIYTKTGKNSGIGKTIKTPGAITFKVDGFYETREFYSPDYSTVNKNTEKVDRRTTLYWNPSILTSKNSNADITFFTSDEKGTYQIEIEGVTETGIPFHQTSFIEVE